MNYWKIYISLIQKAKKRIEIQGYSEKHHIMPKCLGGSDRKSNLIRLTGREHFIAHLLLVKAIVYHKNSYKLWFAVHLMMHDKRRIINKRYQEAKTRLILCFNISTKITLVF